MARSANKFFATPQRQVSAPPDADRGSVLAGNSPKRASEASLGNLRNRYAGEAGREARNPNKTRAKQTAKIAAKNARREDRLGLQRVAAELTPSLRVRHCLWTPTGNTVELLKRQQDARFNGVQTCGSVWSCPCCSARISEVRRGELRQLEEWAGSPRRGLRMVMMTLTARHRRRSLTDMVDRMTKAKTRMQDRKIWQRLRQGGHLAGTVSVREATHGDQGWHPHYHVLCLIEAETDAEAIEMLEPMRSAWLDCLRKEGLTGTAQRAFHLQTGDAVSAYISKHGRDQEDRAKAEAARSTWGIAEEMTLARTKRGKTGESRSPWQILRDAAAGDEASERLWQEYALTMHGRRQQVWSNGLKLACGIEEIEDEQAAEGEEYTEEEDETVAVWSAPEWRRVRHRRAELLAAAESGGAEAVERAIAGSEPEDGEVIEPELEPKDQAAWRPRPRGLAAAALAAVERPQGSYPLESEPAGARVRRNDRGGGFD